MKEVTLVCNIQTTDVFRVQDDFELNPVEYVEQKFKEFLQCDDVKLTNRQIFVRDLPDQCDHTEVVETP